VILFVVITRPHNNDRWHRHATVYVIINYTWNAHREFRDRNDDAVSTI